MAEMSPRQPAIWAEAEHAIRCGALESLQRLFQTHEAALRQPNEIKLTLMHCAAVCGAVPIIEYLSSVGFDINTRDRFGASPLYYAVRNNHKAAVASLRALGGKLTIPNSHKVLAGIQFGWSLIALAIAGFILLRGPMTTIRVLLLCMLPGVIILGISEGIKLLQGKQTMATE